MSDTLDALLRRALEEDRPSRDLTTDAVLAGDAARAAVTATVRAKEAGVVAGVDAALRLAALADPRVVAEARVRDGERVAPGDAVLAVAGPAAAVLRVERPMLNLLQHCSGVATLTARFVDAVAGTGVRVCDTRKTLPGLREIERAAVRAGGGEHHRESLSAALLVKENHVRALARSLPPGGGAYAEAVRRAVAARGTGAETERVRVGIEAETADEAVAAVSAGADLVLLDDFALDALRDAVRRARAAAAAAGRRVLLEASGGVTLERARAIAETGVDRISIGALTHSARALDLSMKIDP